MSSVMDFDLSKENIQPLRGGRNVTQLEVALQAQFNEDYQREILQQKEAFENAIRHYEGEDPLDNWYHYISWVEQSFPKHGHEGNLVALLEDCLSKFEHDKRYIHDRRFCKLWIKYIDMQPNPLELFHMMHAQGLCRSCADLYRAWAYYHEVAGDFKSADMVFQLGEQELAQPYEELVTAHRNLVYAVGQQMIRGAEVDAQRLEEQRRALTTLSTYGHGKMVPSVRIPISAGAGVLPSGAKANLKENVVVPVYQDRDNSKLLGAEAVPPVSILSAAKRQQAPKENTIKPGVWTTALPIKKGPMAHRNPAFTVHEDIIDLHSIGIKLPDEFYPVSHEDFSNWNPPLAYFEPEDPSRIPMYPKSKVYANPKGEVSIEEVRATKYKVKGNCNRLNISHSETNEAIQSILGDGVINQKVPFQEHQQQQQHIGYGQNEHFQNYLPRSEQFQYQQVDVGMAKQEGAIRKSYELMNNSQQQQQHFEIFSQQQPMMTGGFGQFHNQHLQPSQQPQSNHFDQHQTMSLLNRSQLHMSNQFPQQQQMAFSTQQFQMQPQQQHKPQQPTFNKSKNNNILSRTPCHSVKQAITAQTATIVSPAGTGFANLSTQQANTPVNRESPNMSSEFGKDMVDLWRFTTEEDSNSLPPIKGTSKFAIFEDDAQLKGTAMKSPPFRIISDEELAETGSRGGQDVAAAAQPCDGAKRIPIFEDDSNSPIKIIGNREPPILPDLNASCNTQMFNVNLNAMQVSTPQSKRTEPLKDISEETLKQSKKMLFGPEPEKKHMSTIFEETTKDYRSSSSSGSSTFKSVMSNQSKRENMAVISEEESNYNFNLAQNMKANAALRLSLLGDLMECESGQSSPVTDILPTLPPAPLHIEPLSQAPSDPFKSTVIETLLKHVAFPNRHTAGYIEIFCTPRFTIKKEPCRIGDDRYLIEKMLGKGTYGQVYKATDLRTKEVVALKIQKPPNKWEFYICREIQSRLAKHPLRDRFMQVPVGYFNDQMSILVSEFSRCGSLLDVANAVKQKTGKTLKEPFCIFFSMEMLSIVQALHKAKIIHADVKPDNFLVFVAPDQTITLQLIDFGCSIDMTLFPESTTFTRCVTTEDFVCCEMRDGRPWNYHTDLFCVAASAHVLLFDKYIQLQKKDGHWSITQRFTRYMSLELWNTFFANLLNQQAGLADPEPLLGLLREAFYASDRTADMRYLANVLKDR
ncbi:probable inactive serine/threonine-protein kinase bub1 isoform X4 [Agrilus planipennis]|uniref:Probable inactive serine/threonine-protein kinase bub1 isoform X3 n=1 Tax=Agrilus planipennis TaxID=224129 RepID=A0A7F5QZ52_AGRPL|nr:probable inactive serine/threonine-protein kinase bub1 isoform X3 [Agrilus planipennis]XP_025830576.1 probable inactive serine/threonine-protein kinase bub1 isoform X4 [Agrilus planipennis]